MTRPVDAVIEFLEAEQARGIHHILLDDGPATACASSISAPRADKASRPETPRRTAQPPAEEPAARRHHRRPFPRREDQGRTTGLAAETGGSWAPARSLGTLRETMVFATGNPDARIMLVGEAPGYHEEKEHEPSSVPPGKNSTTSSRPWAWRARRFTSPTSSSSARPRRARRPTTASPRPRKWPPACPSSARRSGS